MSHCLIRCSALLQTGQKRLLVLGKACLLEPIEYLVLKFLFEIVFKLFNARNLELKNSLDSPRVGILLDVNFKYSDAV